MNDLCKKTTREVFEVDVLPGQTFGSEEEAMAAVTKQSRAVAVAAALESQRGYIPGASLKAAHRMLATLDVLAEAGFKVDGSPEEHMAVAQALAPKAHDPLPTLKEKRAAQAEADAAEAGNDPGPGEAHTVEASAPPKRKTAAERAAEKVEAASAAQA